jgi:hypothetical protein
MDKRIGNASWSYKGGSQASSSWHIVNRSRFPRPPHVALDDLGRCSVTSLQGRARNPKFWTDAIWLLLLYTVPASSSSSSSSSSFLRATPGSEAFGIFQSSSFWIMCFGVCGWKNTGWDIPYSTSTRVLSRQLQEMGSHDHHVPWPVWWTPLSISLSFFLGFFLFTHCFVHYGLCWTNEGVSLGEN